MSRLNIRHINAITTNVCTIALFLGIKPHLKNEFKAAFGDYVKLHQGSDNTSNAHSYEFTAFYLAGTYTVAWILWYTTIGFTHSLYEDDHNRSCYHQLPLKKEVVGIPALCQQSMKPESIGMVDEIQGISSEVPQVKEFSSEYVPELEGPEEENTSRW